MKWPLTAVVLLCSAAVFHPNQCSAASDVRSKCFGSAEQAVRRIKVMLRQKNWEQLARYYDLRGSDVLRSELASGSYFYDKQPANVDAAGFLRWLQPFDPRFQFDRVENTNQKDVIRVVVTISIDEGFGAIRRGFQSFRMRKTSRGYQLVLDPPEK